MKSCFHTIGAFEAKTQFGELLDQVIQGSEFTITQHDRPVARLIGFKTDVTAQRTAATAAIHALRTRYTLQGLDARMLRSDGRA
jgi:prevent-host-death family protein